MKGEKMTGGANQPTLRFGIIGVGAAGGEARSILSHPQCTVTAAADKSKGNLDKFVAEFSCDAYLDVEQMCAAPNVDAVFIGTPTQFHSIHAMTAIEHGKHVILAKPMATTLEDAKRMVDAAERKGVWLSVGHTQAFEPPIFKIREVVESGELGRLGMINMWYFTDWIYRGRVPEELDSTQGGGVVYRQGAHQFDIVRWIGGGLVRTVRAMTGIWDSDRPTEGCYSAFLTFEGGAVATCVFNGYDHFHSVELGFGISEGGGLVSDVQPAAARKALRRAQASDEGEAAYKAARRSGAGRPGREPAVSAQRQRSVDGEPERNHSFYGLTIVSCEHGDIRQSPEGLLIYDDEGKREVAIPKTLVGRDIVVNQLYDAVASGIPPPHDSHWGLGTLELQLAVLESGGTQREVQLSHQVLARSPGPLH